jgi:hypothetical protein
MGIEWFRDLSITILCFVTTAALIFAATLAYRLYRALTSTLLSVKAASQSISDTVTLVQEGVKPLIGILAMIQGIRQGFECVSKMFKKESNEGGDSDE